MSQDIKFKKFVDKIIEDVCEDCDERIPLCDFGVCENVVREIGCFCLYCAQKEKEEQEKK